MVDKGRVQFVDAGRVRLDKGRVRGCGTRSKTANVVADTDATRSSANSMGHGGKSYRYGIGEALESFEGSLSLSYGNSSITILCSAPGLNGTLDPKSGVDGNG